MVWETAQSLGGQIRIVAGMGGGGVVGLDMGAALALGQAMGCDMELLGAVLPEIESAVVTRSAETPDQEQSGREFDQ